MKLDQDFVKHLGKMDHTFKLIGHGISLWSFMEGNIILIFAKLMGTTNEKAGLVLYSMNFMAWLPLVTDLFANDKKYGKISSKWNKKFERLRSMNNTRVRLAHHTILENSDSLLQVPRFDTRQKSLAQSPLNDEELSEFIDKIIAMNNELAMLFNEMPR